MPTFYNLRKLLISTFAIEQIVHYRIPVFQGVTVETCISVIRNLIPDNNHELLFCEIEDSFRNPENYIHVKQLSVMKSISLNLHFKADDISEKLFDKVASNCMSLGNIAKIVCGIKPYQKGKGKPKQTEESVSKRIFDANHRAGETYRQYIMGRDFHKYHWQIEKERWLNYGDWLAEPRHSAPFDALEKIVIRQTADEIIANLDTNQYLTLNNVHNLILSTNTLSLKYLLGVLNSKLITWWYRHLMPEKGRVFAEVKVINLEKLPIREIDIKNPDDINLNFQIQELVTRIIKTYHQPMTDELTETVENHKEKIDNCVYQLYGLTKDEIALVESES
jgi:hypothetical protein